MTDDPLDLTQVAADEAAIESLRLRSINPDDSALQLMRDLLIDLDSEPDLSHGSAPVGHGSTVLRLAGEAPSDKRVARGGTVVALLAAGVVAFGGVAAASTAVVPGGPLQGIGETVRAAAGAVVDAVKPPDTVRRADPAQDQLPASASSRASEALTSRPSVPVGPVVPEAAAQARSDAAARQVEALLTEAEELLDRGRTAAAQQRLDVAERRLADVPADLAVPLRTRLDQLRRDVADAAATTRTGPASPAKPEPKSEPRSEPKPDKADSRSEPEVEAPAPEEPAAAGQSKTAPAPAAERVAPLDESRSPAQGRTFLPGQPSRLASEKPRA